MLMSAQKTHHIPVIDHIFGSFYLVVSAFFFALYQILGFSCILSEKGGIWKLCGDLKKEIEESSASTSRRSHFAMSQSRDIEVV